MTGEPSSAVLLAARGVSRRYGRRVALEPTDVDVEAGESLALVGPNGAGKSTLLAILARALAPSSGRVETTAAGGRVGWAPQRPAVYRHLSAKENLELFARLEGLDAPEDAAARMLASVGLEGAPVPAGRLSVGTQQRLNLAVALLGDPLVLLLDEPTASLDPGQRRRVWEIADGVRLRGGAVVFASHELDEVRRHATRVVALAAGRVEAVGTAERLLEGWEPGERR